MSVLRLLMAGLIAVAAMIGVLLTAVVVIFTGLMGWLLQAFGRKAGPVAPQPNQQATAPTDEVIDVVATKVPDEPGER